MGNAPDWLGGIASGLGSFTQTFLGAKDRAYEMGQARLREEERRRRMERAQAAMLGEKQAGRREKRIIAEQKAQAEAAEAAGKAAHGEKKLAQDKDLGEARVEAMRYAARKHAEAYERAARERNQGTERQRRGELLDRFEQQHEAAQRAAPPGVSLPVHPTLQALRSEAAAGKFKRVPYKAPGNRARVSLANTATRQMLVGMGAASWDPAKMAGVAAALGVALDPKAIQAEIEKRIAALDGGAGAGVDPLDAYLED